jgi:hypothetical protein
MRNNDGLIWLGVGVAVLFATAGGALLSIGNLTVDQIANVARNAGFSGNDLITAVSVAMAESGGNPKALGDLGIGNGSFGLWQINSYYHPEYGPDFTVLYDPQTNANAAFAIYSQAGYAFKPWSTFNNGSYASFVSTVQNTVSV